MCKVSSIWPVILTGINFREGITRESMINALVILKECERQKVVEQHRLKHKVMDLEVAKIPGLPKRSDKS